MIAARDLLSQRATPLQIVDNFSLAVLLRSGRALRSSAAACFKRGRNESEEENVTNFRTNKLLVPFRSSPFSREYLFAAREITLPLKRGDGCGPLVQESHSARTVYMQMA